MFKVSDASVILELASFQYFFALIALDTHSANTVYLQMCFHGLFEVLKVAPENVSVACCAL